MKKYYIILAIAFLALGSILWWWRSKPLVPDKQPVPSEVQTKFETQKDEKGSVKISVTPQNPAEGVFSLVLDTHSVELTDDLTQVSVLKSDGKREYRPLKWEGSPPGGHHREGTLYFGPLSPVTRRLELIIKGVG